MTDLRGAHALVTGAYGGIGRSISSALAREGAELVLTGRNAEALESLAGELGGRVVVADLASRAGTDRVIAEAGEVDILVANAAVPASGDLGDWGQDQIDVALEVNLASPIVMTRALLPKFRRRGRGHFVYISSLSGKVGTLGGSLYSATKFGLRGFAGGLRADLHGSDIGVSVVNPGFVRDAGMFADSGGTLPFGIGTVTPDAVAKAVVRAILRNRAEIDVAPLNLRLGAIFGMLMPGLSAATQARLGVGIAESTTDGQRDKRPASR